MQSNRQEFPTSKNWFLTIKNNPKFLFSTIDLLTNSHFSRSHNTVTGLYRSTTNNKTELVDLYLYIYRYWVFSEQLFRNSYCICKHMCILTIHFCHDLCFSHPSKLFSYVTCFFVFCLPLLCTFEPMLLELFPGTRNFWATPCISTAGTRD